MDDVEVEARQVLRCFMVYQNIEINWSFSTFLCLWFHIAYISCKHTESSKKNIFTFTETGKNKYLRDLIKHSHT